MLTLLTTIAAAVARGPSVNISGVPAASALSTAKHGEKPTPVTIQRRSCTENMLKLRSLVLGV